MLYRIKQFFQGLTAKINQKDLNFIHRYLSPQEEELFLQLRKSEQRHSLNVAYGCYKEKPNDSNLIKAALLHDIGKLGSNLTLINKAFVVIAEKIKLNPNLMPNFFKKAYYYKTNHPQLGYKRLLPLIKEEKVLLLIRDHHKENLTSTEEMKILQHYDNLY